MVRALNANFRLGGAPRAMALANYSINDKATVEMRAEALKQLGCLGRGAAARPRRRHLQAHEIPRATDAVTALEPEVARLLVQAFQSRCSSRPSTP